MEAEEAAHPSRHIRNENEQRFRRNRIVPNLRDYVLSQFADSKPSLSGDASSTLQRVRQLFTSYKTPTHPAYALMIHRAITELDEENGSSAKAISYFMQKEYDDLPWAHEKILALQLAKLCKDEELVCNEGGRYVLVADGDGNKAEEDKGDREKSKKGKKRKDVGGGRKGKVAKGDEVVKRGNELQAGGIEELALSHDSDSDMSDEPIRNLVRTQEKGGALSQSIGKDEEQAKSEMGLNEADGIEDQVLFHESDSARSDEQIEEEEHNQSIERAEDQAKSQEGWNEVIGKWSQSKLRGTRVIKPHSEAEAPAQESQPQDSILQSETFCLSSPTELNAVVDSQQPLLPSSKCVPSAEKGLLLTQMELQKSSASDTCGQKPASGDPEQNHTKPQDHTKHLRRGRPPKAKPPADNQGNSSLPLRGAIADALKPNVKKMKKQLPSLPQGRGRIGKQHGIVKNEANLACVNVDNDQLQHGNQGNPKQNLSENPISGDPEQNQGNPKRNLSENSISGDPEQNLPKRPRGRPPKSRTVANNQGEPMLSSDDGIPSELKPNLNEMENQIQYGQGRGRGRGVRGRGRGTGRGRGRPPINRDADLQHGTGSRGGRGRGRGRPRKLDRSANPSEEQPLTQDQAECPEQRPSQSQSEAEQSQQQQGQGCDQNQDEGQERLPDSSMDGIGEPPAATPTNM